MKLLLVLLASPFLAGAACQHNPPAPDSKIPASLKVLCQDLPLLTAGDGGTVTRWGVAARATNSECKLRHEKLVKALEAIETK